ncbi:hypothetical protein [Paenibacillus sp. 1A_MP2]|uniref:hypothetical protein n=1 Tax=Paenibacillus sp. 1A_MP2 TaxID=3457495 RepID=UPI003FCED561
MENILDGTSLTTQFESAKNILGVSHAEFVEFLQSQRYRVKMKDGGYYYENLCVDDILEYFNLVPEDIYIDAVLISHITPIIDRESFYQYGMLSLKELFRLDTPFKSFMLEFGITPLVNENGHLKLLVNDVPKSSPYLDYRMNRDRRINGFMFNEKAEEDNNIEEMLKCPEFISKVSDELVDAWAERSRPSVITFKAFINEIDVSTISLEDHTNIHTYFLHQLVERLLFVISHYADPRNPMIYLNESVNIDANRIIGIRDVII